MPSQMDMATALELQLESDQEMKFQALKNLQSKKIKYLMTSIDARDKELAKIKVLGKDNRRTQMIQALRNKLRDQELVCDVTKEELSRRNEMSLEEVNAYIIKKTLGGPKRFRPLSREELELKISELEKKLKRAGDGPTRYVAPVQQISPFNSYSRGAVKNPTSAPDDLSTIARLADELQNLRTLLDSRDATIEQQREDVSRLRNRNGELRVTDEEMDFQDRSNRELKSSYDQLSSESDETAEKLSATSEEIIILRGELASERDISRTEIDGLQEQCQRLLRQNSSLLKSMATMENDLERALHNVASASNISSADIAGSAANASTLAALEAKLCRANDKLQMMEERYQDLTSENAQINILKDTLRDRNNSIKDLKRSLEEKDKARSSGPSDISTDALRIRMADMMNENKTLKQALAAATAGVRGGTERVGK